MDSDSSPTTVTIEAPAWRTLVTNTQRPVDPTLDVQDLVDQAVDASLARCLPTFLGPKLRPVEVSVLLTDDARMAVFNREWRGQDKATNVLSFPGLDRQELVFLPTGAPVMLGDIVVALETVQREAGVLGIAPADHLSHLVVHGVLHLLGHDHEVDEEALLMEALETELLAELGLPDPHAPRPAMTTMDDSALAQPTAAPGGSPETRP